MSRKLAEKAMLVSLNISAWNAKRTDKKATRELAEQHQIAPSRLATRKEAIDTEAPSYKAVKSAISSMRQLHYELTLPWAQEGARILTTAMFEHYTQKMRHAKAVIEQAVKAFAVEFPTLKAAARIDLKGLFNERDYPAHVESKFRVETVPMPMPDEEDFRAHLSDEDVEEIKGSIKAELGRAFEQAVRDPYERLYAHINRMVERLSKDDNRFTDTIVTGLAELCQILPALNFTGDQRLEGLRKRAERMVCDLDPQDLKDKPSVRRNVVRQALDIQQAMAVYMGEPEPIEEEQAHAA